MRGGEEEDQCQPKSHLPLYRPLQRFISIEASALWKTTVCRPGNIVLGLSLIHISEPTRPEPI
eukprot:7033828-Pyramimonas_sp.AAC.1